MAQPPMTAAPMPMNKEKISIASITLRPQKGEVKRRVDVVKFGVELCSQ